MSNFEDPDDDPGDRSTIEYAFNFRRFMREQAAESLDPMCASMLEMDRLADEAGLLIDYDPDFDDINNDW